MNAASCPRCNNPAGEMVKVETGMKLGLQEAGQLEGLPDAVCAKCYTDLSRFVSQGARLRAERKAKDANRLNLWRNRVNIVKQGRELMAQKAFADAAIAYEKYLRVLEIVYDRKAGELKPDLFKNTARAKELTIVTSVLWDLMRIYDTHQRYADRQAKVAVQLIEFGQASPIFPDIVRKAAAFATKAKNRQNFENFLKMAKVQRSRCFIATAAFANPLAPEIRLLCLFRDQRLKRTPWGRRCILYYYRYSPGIAEFLDTHPMGKAPCRWVLRIVANFLSFLFLRNLNLKSTLNQ